MTNGDPVMRIVVADMDGRGSDTDQDVAVAHLGRVNLANRSTSADPYLS